MKYSNAITRSNETWLQDEVGRLRKKVEDRDKMIVQKEILIDRYKRSIDMWRDRAEEYEEKFGKLE